MSTVVLELTKYIDPTLTWKTVSKGRNTSRRSRRPVSKTTKMDQGPGKKNPKRLNGAQSSESDKSDVSVNGRGFAGNMEHIPIKKRRFLLRTPSPPPRSPNHLDEDKELDSAQCTSEQRKYSNGITEPLAWEADFSGLSVCKKSVFGGEVEKIANALDGAHGLHEDFSGIEILAAAACSDRLDNSGDDAGTSNMGILEREDSVSSTLKSSINEGIAVHQPTNFLGKSHGQLKEEGCSAGLPTLGTQSVCLNNTAEVDGEIRVSESLKAKPIESVGSLTDRKESFECHASLEESSVDLPNNGAKVAEKTSESGSRDFKFHWDLNVVMDEWDHPLDDTVSDSAVLSTEVAPTNAVSSQISENVEPSELLEGSVANEDSDKTTVQPAVCPEPESQALPDCAGFVSVTSSFSMLGSRLEVSSGLVTSQSNKNCPLQSENGCAVDTTLNDVEDLENERDAVHTDADVDQSLSLGLKRTETSEKTCDTVASESQIMTAAELSLSTPQIVQPEIREIDFSLVPLSGEAPCEVDGDSECIEDSKEITYAVENNSVATTTCQSMPTEAFPGNKFEIAALEVSLSGKVSSDANCINYENSVPLEHLKSTEASENKPGEAVVQSAEVHLSCSEAPIGDLRDSAVGVSHSPSELDNMVEASATIVSEQAMDMVTTEEVEKPTISEASKCDHLMENGSDVCEAAVLEKLTCDSVNPKDVKNPLEDDLRVSDKESSQMTENLRSAADIEGGYDSHLEDGELREPAGHCWEDNEGEEGETEHVDYDSDNREGMFLEGGNDSVQLSGEVLGECEMQSCRSDTLSSADYQPCPAKGLSTADDTEFEYIKRESPSVRVCSGVQLNEENNFDRVEAECNDCKSDVETDSIGKENANDTLRSTRGASVSGREPHFSERRMVDSMRRSRSSNFEEARHTGGSGESLTRREFPAQSDRSWNAERNSVADSVRDDDRERTVRASDASSPGLPQSRIISTSKTGYHLTSRRSPGGKDHDYCMGMVKVRDISPDYNGRRRFDRFPNGINRGFREGYRRPGMYEGGKPAGSMLNHYGKRERSFSPIDNRVGTHIARSHRNSRSRSRTRSPDFRSEARMVRPRLPYQQPASHAGGHMRERRSPVRVFNQRQRFNNMSSPGRPRSDDCMRPMMRPMRFQDTSGRGHDYEQSGDYRRKPFFLRNNRRSRSRSRSCSPDFRSNSRMGSMRVPYPPSADNIRDRRSPVRSFRPGQRYDGGSSPGRLRSDDCMRPMMRPARFSDTSQPGRGHEYDNGGDDYRRKPRNIFERIHPVRPGDVDGEVRRYQYNKQDNLGSQGFRRNESYGRGGGDRRPVEAFQREDRGNERYNSDRVFYSGPKQFGGTRDYPEDSLPRGARP